MKKITSILMAAALLLTASCSLFLEKPDTTGTVDQQAVFSTTKNAQAALMSCYQNVLRHGWPGGMGIGHCTYGAISGEVGRGYNWHSSYHISQQGLSVNGTDGSDAGAEHFGNNWRFIRECYLVKENIDYVADMSDADKEVIKAEVSALIAYRYMGMFYRYGGVPIVRKSFFSTDDLSARRATVQEMVDFICELCDEAYQVLPAKWDNANTGRMTKGAALAIKARTLQFAARPLFNSATPYLSMKNAEDNAYICFGNADKERWKAAIDANEAVLSWASSNGVRLLNTGGAGEGKPNPNAFDDYGKATSTPSNEEIILAFKFNSSNVNDPIVNFINCSRYETGNRYDTDCSGVLTNHLENYWAADGTEMSWPRVGDAMPRSGSDWIANIAKIEPRALADIKFGGHDSANNPGDYNWQNIGWNRGGYSADKDKGDVFPNAIDSDKGCGERTKFYYHAGNRVWFEPPLFRLAETYLYLAEAYNEYGNSAKALENLNKVHNRAGLPSITETDQAKLRAIIQREFAVEFFQENHRYYDVKHWKRSDIGNGICGGAMRMLQFNIKNDDAATWPYAAKWIDTYWDAVAYESYWNDAMFLEPFPQSEINKGTLVQNPGY
ncbi:MAG: RagB/SusD family nutrient uptake outer membrane protein [Bacteroidales bacterium]|nr:RagB/SusD family nutrient uptake outer membrane protein [Bacteroidales bacterium]